MDSQRNMLDAVHMFLKYPINVHKPGKVKIFDINDPYIEGILYEQKFGDEKGVALIKDAFTSINMDVDLYEGEHSKENIKDYLKKCEPEFAEFSAFVCVFFYCGNNIEIATSKKHETIPITEIVELIEDFKTLQHKPKLFLFQVCRFNQPKNKPDSVSFATEYGNRPVDSAAVLLKAHYADCLILQSSDPISSYSEQKNGRFHDFLESEFTTNECYVEKLSKAIKDLSDHEEICRLLTRVNNEITSCEVTRMSSFTSMLTKELYLKNEAVNEIKKDTEDYVQTQWKSSVAFTRELAPNEVYALTSKTPGKVSIFNMYSFSAKNKQEEEALLRKGSEEDVTCLSETFIEIGMVVEVKINQNKSSVIQYLTEYGNESSRQYDVHIFVFMSHGNDDAILTSNCELIDMKEIIELVEGLYNIRQKPKIFIFQTCRGDKNNRKKGSPQKYVGRLEASVEFLNFAKFSDCLLVQSTIPGYKAWRNDEGSWFIQEFCKAIRDYSKHLDICQILTKVNNVLSCMYKVEKKTTQQLRMQMSAFSSMLTKSLYLTKDALRKAAIKPKVDYVEKIQALVTQD